MDLNKAVNNVVDEVDKKYFRQIQKKHYLCSAKCFDQKELSTELIQQCVERCQQPVQQAQQVLNNEMNSFQSRLERCGMDCQDKIRDQMPTNGDINEEKMAKLQVLMEACSSACAKDHLKLLVPMQRRIEESLKKL